MKLVRFILSLVNNVNCKHIVRSFLSRGPESHQLHDHGVLEHGI
jgi:hypothetical protein